MTTTTKHKDAHTTEITAVALEVILAHMSHLEQLEKFIATEKEILQNLNKDVGITITDMTITSDIEGRLCDLTEEQVCDYFESVHACVNKQRTACEEVLREMERISQGTVSTASISDASPSSDIAQSPYGDADSTLQRNLRDEFDE
jgi:F420-0:gamma-glutamyl ligase